MRNKPDGRWRRPWHSRHRGLKFPGLRSPTRSRLRDPSRVRRRGRGRGGDTSSPSTTSRANLRTDRTYTYRGRTPASSTSPGSILHLPPRATPGGIPGGAVGGTGCTVSSAIPEPARYLGLAGACVAGGIGTRLRSQRCASYVRASRAATSPFRRRQFGGGCGTSEPVRGPGGARLGRARILPEPPSRSRVPWLTAGLERLGPALGIWVHRPGGRREEDHELGLALQPT